MRGRKLVIAWQEEAATLREVYRQEEDAEIKPRLHALWLLRSGYSMRQAADLVACHYVTLQQWVAWYRAGGVAEVRRHQHGGRQGAPSKLTPIQLAQVSTAAEQGNFRTAQDVQAWIAQTFGVQYALGGIYTLVARHKWKPKVPRPQAMKVDDAVQAAWKKGGSQAL